MLKSCTIWLPCLQLETTRQRRRKRRIVRNDNDNVDLNSKTRINSLLVLTHLSVLWWFSCTFVTVHALDASSLWKNSNHYRYRRQQQQQNNSLNEGEKSGEGFKKKDLFLKLTKSSEPDSINDVEINNSDEVEEGKDSNKSILRKWLDGILSQSDDLSFPEGVEEDEGIDGGASAETDTALVASLMIELKKNLLSK